MRLLEAKQLLMAGGISVAKVAFSVGYVSPSQFSREYRGMFGVPPASDLARLGRSKTAKLEAAE